MKNQSFPIAIVVSRFNEPVTSALQKSALTRLQEYGFSDQDITVVQVPGAVEIPLIAKHLAKKNHYQAIIALGAVIRGETTHYDYVCQQVSYGCQKVALEENLPVVFGILTTEDGAQAKARMDKGRDAVDTAVEMVSLLKD